MNIQQQEEFRYWFAGLAMQAILANDKLQQSCYVAAEKAGEDPGIFITSYAVVHADDLIAALKAAPYGSHFDVIKKDHKETEKDNKPEEMERFSDPYEQTLHLKTEKQ